MSGGRSYWGYVRILAFAWRNVSRLISWIAFYSLGMLKYAWTRKVYREERDVF